MLKKTLFLMLAGALAVSGMARADDSAQSPPGGDAALVKRGEYLAVVGDCMACHTAAKGKPFAGGLPLKVPMLGTIYSTNITPDKNTGIGTWSYEDFERAVRKGVAKDGHNLYPAMPYVSYAKIGDDDMKALYAYFEHGVQPIDQPQRASDIPWPLNMRWPLTVWNWVFLKEGSYQPKPGKSVEWNRGAYLVQGLAHCARATRRAASRCRRKRSTKRAAAFFRDPYFRDGTATTSHRMQTAASDHGPTRSSHNICARAAYRASRRPRARWAKPWSTASRI